MNYQKQTKTKMTQVKLNPIIKKAYKQRLINDSIETWWEFIETQDKQEVADVIEHMYKVERRLKSFKNGYYYQTKIRKYCNLIMYSDVEPYEVVKVISDKTVEIRPMIATQVEFPQTFIKGGFAGHCVDNHNQKWEFKSNESAPVIRVRKTKRNGWRHGSMKFQMSDHPCKFYDYNF